MKMQNILDAVRYCVTHPCTRKEAMDKFECNSKIGILSTEAVMAGLEHVYFSIKGKVDLEFNEDAWKGMIEKVNKSKCLPRLNML